MELQPPPPLHIDATNNNNSNNNNDNNNGMVVVAGSATCNKPKKKAGGSRMWMRFDLSGQTEVLDLEKSAIIKRVSIPTRDLRILGPLFSHSSNILAREKAMVVNMEFIKAIVTAEEVLLLDPLVQEVLPFVDQLRQQLSHRRQCKESETQSTDGHWLPVPEAADGLQCELPFEFLVLEIALEVVCTNLDSRVADLERDAYPVLDELARKVSTKNLELVRSLKSNLTHLLARVQKVRDEIDHLLDDNEDMAHLYLTRRWIQNQQHEDLVGAAISNSVIPVAPNLPQASLNWSASLICSKYSDDTDVADLEMLLEAYFTQLDGTRNKILSVREYIDDTEDYVNIQLSNQRNGLIQVQLTLTIASFAILLETLITGVLSLNIPCPIFNVQGIFGAVVGGMSSFSFLIFLLLLGYARWKKLLGS